VRPKDGDHIYDPTCGSGGLLLQCLQVARENPEVNEKSLLLRRYLEPGTPVRAERGGNGFRLLRRDWSDSESGELGDESSEKSDRPRVASQQAPRSSSRVSLERRAIGEECESELFDHGFGFSPGSRRAPRSPTRRLTSAPGLRPASD
jgi:hypothetical protein